MNETILENPEKTVRPISYEATKPFILLKHYAGRMPSVSYAFGLYLDNKLMGICTFGKPASQILCEWICGQDNTDIVYELNRLVIDEDAPKNSASYLVGNAIKQLPKPTILVSYADIGYGHIGYVYQATNWIYTGLSADRTDYINVGLHQRHVDRSQSMIKRRRSRKHRYVYFHASKTGRKKLRSLLRYEVLPYPKGDTSRHNVDVGFYKQDDLPMMGGGE